MRHQEEFLLEYSNKKLVMPGAVDLRYKSHEAGGSTFWVDVKNSTRVIQVLAVCAKHVASPLEIRTPIVRSFVQNLGPPSYHWVQC